MRINNRDDLTTTIKELKRFRNANSGSGQISLLSVNLGLACECLVKCVELLNCTSNQQQSESR